MHPFLFKIGSFPVGTYGLLLVIGFFGAMGLAMHLARKEKLSEEAIYDVTITVLLAGIVGAKLLMILVGLVKPAGQEGALAFRDLFTLATLRAGGHIHGGIIAATAVFFWRARKWKLPMASTLDVFATALPLGQAIGRLGCFMAGCCYGSECTKPWAVTFHNPEAYAYAGTPLDMPLHPVQLYAAVAGFLIVTTLFLLHKKRLFKGQIIAGYFLLEGIARMILETWRGDVDRGFWFGLSWLSTGRLTGLAFVIFGAALWCWFSQEKKAVRA